MRKVIISACLVVASMAIGLIAIEALLRAFDSRHFIRFRTPVEKRLRHYYVADPDMGFDLV